MRGLLVAFLFSILLLSSVSAVQISEIKSKGIEFIEIWNEDKEQLNLSSWTIKDNSTDNPDTLKCAIDNCSLETDAEYFLIIGKSASIENITSEDVIYFYTDDQKIGNGLNDNGDIVIIKENNETIASSEYGAIENSNFSFQLVDNEFCEGTPTPGEANACYEEVLEPEPEESPDIENETLAEEPRENETSDNEGADEEQEPAEEITITTNTTPAKKTSAADSESKPEEKKVIYQSKNERMKDAAIYLLGGLVIALFLYILKSNKL